MSCDLHIDPITDITTCMHNYEFACLQSSKFYKYLDLGKPSMYMHEIEIHFIA